MDHRHILRWALLTLALCVNSAFAANTYFVRQTGSDSNNGTSPTTALRTIQAGINKATVGDVVWVGAGTYNERLTTARSGTSTGHIRIAADTDGFRTGDAGAVIVQGASGSSSLTMSHDWIDVEGITFTGGTTAVTSTSNASTLRNCLLSNQTTHGILVNSGAFNIVNTTISGAGTYGVSIAGGNFSAVNSVLSNKSTAAIYQSGASSNTTIDRCQMISNGYGIHIANGYARVGNSVIRNSTSIGILIIGGTANADVWNNTIVANGLGAVVWNARITLRNNIITEQSWAFFALGSSTINHNNNLYWSNSNNYGGVSAGTGDVYSDPRFLNRVANNFCISDTSPAIGAGTVGSSQHAPRQTNQNYATGLSGLDMNGITRPKSTTWTIGAFEPIGTVGPVPYFDDFESSTGTWPEWSGRTVQAGGSPAGRVAGPYGNSFPSLRVATTPGTRYSIIFDLWVSATWDGNHPSYGTDYFGLSVNGVDLYRETFSNFARADSSFNQTTSDLPERRDGNFGLSGSDCQYVSFTADFTATGSTSFVNFFGQGLTGWSDEGWFIDNVRVVTLADSAPFRSIFSEVGQVYGLSTRTGALPGGAYWADFNTDGRLDFVGTPGNSYVSNSSQSKFFQTTALRTSTNLWLARGGVLADFDADGDTEFIARENSTAATPRLFRNAGGIIGQDMGDVGLGRSNNAGDIVGVDIDQDGWIDIASFGSSNFVGYNRIATNGVGTTAFAIDITVLPGTASDVGSANVTTGDLNNDGVPDFFSTAGSGRFFLSSRTTSGTIYNASTCSISAPTGDALRNAPTFADYDNDGDLDLFVANRTAGSRPYLFRNVTAIATDTFPNPVVTFSDISATVGLTAMPGGSSAGCFGDYDNDGDLDLFIVGATGASRLYRTNASFGSSGPTMTEMPLQGLATDSRGGDAVWVDYDNDGDLDLSMGGSDSSANFASYLFENSTNTSNYLRVRVAGLGTGGTDKSGVGARIELWDSTNTVFIARRDIAQARGFAQEPTWAHFGGVSLSGTYTLRLVSSRGTQTQTVTPATATTTIGSRTVPQLFTFTEAPWGPAVTVVQWEEIADDPNSP